MRRPAEASLPRIAAGMLLLSLVLASCDRAPVMGPDQLRPLMSESGGEQGGATSFIGDATVINATILGATTGIAKAGPLPSEGGADDALLLGAAIPGVLSATLVHATTIGAGDRSVAEASVANLQLHAGVLNLAASFVKASASSQCNGGAASSSAKSRILGLVINGKSINVTGQPNQTINLPLGLGRVVLNEVVASEGEVRVNAIHAYVLGVANVVVAAAHAGVTCAADVPTPCTDDDFVTGDGFITGTPAGTRGDLALAAGVDGGVLFFGHLTFNDNAGNGPQVVGTSLTKYLWLSPTTRRMEGAATVNGESGFTFAVEVTDGGPGQSDVFTIFLSSGYQASGTVAGGGIELVSDLCPVPT